MSDFLRPRRFAWLGLPSLLAGLGLAACDAAWAQAQDPLVSTPAQIKLGIEKVQLPGDEKMGLVGTTYLVDVGHGFHVGPAAYGAISGQRGGLFTVGVEGGWQRRLAGPLALDLGFYAGGGGGGAAPVGGGLMLRPHADLLWDFGPFLAGLSWSQVRFANGDINSRQLGLVWSARSDFRFVPSDRVGERSAMGGRSGMGFDRLHAVFGAYEPRPGARRNSGGELASTIAFVGTRVERALGDHVYWGLEAGGAASGGVAGYAEYLGTLGTETTVWPGVLTLGGRVALGMGGGGDVGVGGGLLMKAGVYGTLRLTRELGLTLEGGYTRAPQGSFRALHTAASLNWILDDPSDITAPARSIRSEWVGGVERYPAQRNDGSRRMLQAVTLKANRFVTRHVYLSGQAHSAYGGGAGGYTAGLFGAGVQFPVFGPVHAGAEALIGAAGGGGVATQGGAIMQPGAYVGVDLGRSLSLRVGAGKIKSLRAKGLDANVVDVALAFTFGIAGHGNR
ncbi:MAG TPA: hypothetical protein VF169_06870 [Albitalea sp.]|uniref:hypothetical protein n=1 Tax=Piscinibacter sp. TaxID=1903157 RepID=UPI002ED2A1B2